MDQSMRGRPTNESQLADETIEVYVTSLRPVDKKENTKAFADVRVIFGPWAIDFRAVSLVAIGFHLYNIFIPAALANRCSRVPLSMSQNLFKRIREAVVAEYEKYLGGHSTPGVLGD